MVLIFGISSIAHPADLPPGVTDKGAHAVLYAGLGALAVRALAGGWDRPVTIGAAVGAVVLSTMYGVTDEAHQYFVPPREPDLCDLAADGAGATMAAVLLYARSVLKERMTRRTPRTQRKTIS
jgi:VanZ family protein